MYRGCVWLVLICAATSADRTKSVVGIPFRAQMLANANPKLPPPMTAIRTGCAVGAGVVAFIWRDDMLLLLLREDEDDANAVGRPKTVTDDDEDRK
jgi:hypothetical protein